MNSHIDFKETSRLLNGYGSEAITSCSSSSNSSSSSSSSSSCRSSGSGSGKSVPWMQRRRSATFCFVGLVAAAVVGIAALSSTQEGVIIYSSSLWSQKEMFSGKVPNALVPAVLSDVGDTLKLKVYNDDYEKSPASLGIYYKWSYNLEPGRDRKRKEPWTRGMHNLRSWSIRKSPSDQSRNRYPSKLISWQKTTS